jgi:hypothetical protein
VTSPAHLEEILASVRGVAGVDAVELESADGGRLLRVDLVPDAGECELNAAVAAVLAERFALAATETGSRETAGPVQVADGRLVVDRLAFSRLGQQVAAEVSVRLDDRVAPGTKVEDAATDPEATQLQAVAEAVLFALEELTEDAVIATIADLSFLSPDDDTVETATVRLSLDVDGTAVEAAGSAPVLGHRPQAVVRAVLSAVEPHLPV